MCSWFICRRWSSGGILCGTVVGRWLRGWKLQTEKRMVENQPSNEFNYRSNWSIAPDTSEALDVVDVIADLKCVARTLNSLNRATHLNWIFADRFLAHEAADVHVIDVTVDAQRLARIHWRSGTSMLSVKCCLVRISLVKGHIAKRHFAFGAFHVVDVPDIAEENHQTLLKISHSQKGYAVAILKFQSLCRSFFRKTAQFEVQTKWNILSLMKWLRFLKRKTIWSLGSRKD